MGVKLKSLESEDMPNPTTFLGHTWNKQDDTLELPVNTFSESQPVTKRTVLSHLGSMSKRNISIPRLELVGGHMAANMTKNLCSALRGWPIKSTTIWMDSMVALYWKTNPGRPWKVFVSNRVRKMAETTNDVNIDWKYCPTSMNLADQGSRGADIKKMEKGDWFTGPDWLLEEREWPMQPKLKCSKGTDEECKPSQTNANLLFSQELVPDEWDALLDRSTYWRTLRVTVWALRFIGNCQARRKTLKKITGQLGTEEITISRNYWVKRAQKTKPPNLQSPGWKLVKDDETEILKCEGRIKGYKPTCLPEGPLTNKLIAHMHNHIMRLGTSNTMAAIRDKWWIPKLRAKVKKTIRNCHVCKVFSVKPFGPPITSALPKFRTEGSRPFEVTGVDFAGPLHYKIRKGEQGKCYVLIFTCAASRTIHLELTKTQLHN